MCRLLADDELALELTALVGPLRFIRNGRRGVSPHLLESLRLSNLALVLEESADEQVPFRGLSRVVLAVERVILGIVHESTEVEHLLVEVWDRVLNAEVVVLVESWFCVAHGVVVVVVVANAKIVCDERRQVDTISLGGNTTGTISVDPNTPRLVDTSVAASGYSSVAVVPVCTAAKY